MLSRLLCLALVVAAPAARAEWLYRDARIMGTLCAVELWAEDRARGEAAIEQVFAAMRDVDATMSVYKPDSLISRVNAEAASGPVPVSREFHDLIATALDYSRLSGGAFDITFASVGYLYDFRRQVHPDAQAIAAALPAIDWRAVALTPDPPTIRFTKPGVRIDLGGIAKGYAVDRAIEILKSAGFARAMVNAGGDTRMLGDRFGKPWVVGIRNPDAPRGAPPILRIPLVDAAISTSGDYERFFDEGGRRYHHIIDPKTGDSARALRSVTVIASTATRTEGLTKAVFVMGPERGLAFINGLEDADAILVTPQGKVLYSKGLEEPT
jgi:thiamine biosynthesis lipoprotein